MLSIEEFLAECKKRVREKNLDFIPVRKNRESRRKYGLTIQDIENTILSFTQSDYKKGPEEDHSHPNEFIWVFIKEIDTIRFYIKLKLRENGVLACLSFHD